MLAQPQAMFNTDCDLGLIGGHIMTFNWRNYQDYHHICARNTTYLALCVVLHPLFVFIIYLYLAVNIPLVTVVLEGGENTLKTAKCAVKDGAPLVVIQGSGRAADFIARGVNETKTKWVDLKQIVHLFELSSLNKLWIEVI